MGGGGESQRDCGAREAFVHYIIGRGSRILQGLPDYLLRFLIRHEVLVNCPKARSSSALNLGKVKPGYLLPGEEKWRIDGFVPGSQERLLNIVTIEFSLQRLTCSPTRY